MLYRFLLTMALVLFVTGCARLKTTKYLNYRTMNTGSGNDLGLAKSKHEAALELLDQCCPPDAEQCLHEALLADVSFGPAHNTLGKLYYDQRKFYLAAWEFEYAMKTMPGRAEPVNNLGLVYESVEEIDQAISTYIQANEMEPENPEYLGNLLRARTRKDDQYPDTVMLLKQLIRLDHRTEWVDWAKLELVKAEGREIGAEAPPPRLSDPSPTLDYFAPVEANVAPLEPIDDVSPLYQPDSILAEPVQELELKNN